MQSKATGNPRSDWIQEIERIKSNPGEVVKHSLYCGDFTVDFPVSLNPGQVKELEVSAIGVLERVERKWEIDEPILLSMLSTFKNPQDPLWLAIFSEGTDYTEEKSKKGQHYAAEVNYARIEDEKLPNLVIPFTPELQESKLIVQKWRFGNWPNGIHSTVNVCTWWK
ncbi:hypothetical protein K1719_040705 [Acacia pycnantha]|nr:hypothetical protein K1719_040705 [Acacia pycnantha]